MLDRDRLHPQLAPCPCGLAAPPGGQGKEEHQSFAHLLGGLSGKPAARPAATQPQRLQLPLKANLSAALLRTQTPPALPLPPPPPLLQLQAPLQPVPAFPGRASHCRPSGRLLSTRGCRRAHPCLDSTRSCNSSSNTWHHDRRSQSVRQQRLGSSNTSCGRCRGLAVALPSHHTAAHASPATSPR